MNIPEIGTLKIDQIILEILMPPINADLLWSVIIRWISRRAPHVFTMTLYSAPEAPESRWLRSASADGAARAANAGELRRRRQDPHSRLSGCQTPGRAAPSRRRRARNRTVYCPTEQSSTSPRQTTLRRWQSQRANRCRLR